MLVLPFWYWLTRVVQDKEPLNRHACVCDFIELFMEKCLMLVSMQELLDAKHKLESTVQDLTMKQNLLEAENERLRTELATVRQDFTSLGSDRSEQEKEMSQIRMRLAVTEQDLKMKDEQLMHAADELSFERDAKVGVDDFCLQSKVM